MTIKQQGGIFGRNPTFNDITAEGSTSLDGPVVINESGADVDFRVESDTQPNGLFVDGTNGHVGVGIANPPYNFVVSNGGAEGLEIGPGYLGGRTLYQNYNRSTSQYVAAWEYASEYVWNIDGTEKMRLNTSGNLAMASGNGIDFSATSGTGTSELFDDYEEGTWTPTDQSGGSLSFSDADGVYTKIGDLVFAAFAIDYPTTSDTNGIIIGGLPFTVDVKNLSGGTQYGGTVGFTSSLDFAKAALGPINASSTFGVYAQGTTGLVQNSSLSGKIVRGSVIYKT